MRLWRHWPLACATNVVECLLSFVCVCVDGIMSLANRNKSQCQFPNDPFQLCLSSAYSLTYNENVPDLNEKQSQGKKKKRDIVNRPTNDNANICSVSVYTVTFWFFYLCFFFTLFLSKSFFSVSLMFNKSDGYSFYSDNILSMYYFLHYDCDLLVPSALYCFRFYRNVCKVNKNYPQRNFDTYFRHLTKCWPKFPVKNCPKYADKKPLDYNECRSYKNIHEWFLCKLLCYIFSTLSISLVDTSFGRYP